MQTARYIQSNVEGHLVNSTALAYAAEFVPIVAISNKYVSLYDNILVCPEYSSPRGTVKYI